jgi:hypothetical protein
MAGPLTRPGHFAVNKHLCLLSRIGPQVCSLSHMGCAASDGVLYRIPFYKERNDESYEVGDGKNSVRTEGLKASKRVL